MADFCYYNTDYRNDMNQSRNSGDEDSDVSNDENADPDVKALHNKLDKERAEREAWIRQQKVGEFATSCHIRLQFCWLS